MEITSSALALRTARELYYRGRRTELAERYPAVLVLLDDHWIGMEAGMKAVRELVHSQARVRIVLSEATKRRYTIASIARWTGCDDIVAADNRKEDVLAECESIFLPILSFSLLSKLSRLDDEHPFSRLTIRMLFAGKRAAALDVGVNERHPEWAEQGLQPPPAIRRELDGMLGSVRSYGLRIIDQNQMTNWLRVRAKKQIVTAEDLSAAHASGMRSCRLQPGAIVTPLAKDMAAKLGINLHSSESGGR
ncbi:hypothetical protein [Cohnella sp. AR92]|uniref:hypothetical protein n=1 Tax=Cohnella sp. AR92 TaxID=648716 RepID=UPI000F8ED029|nr:hypothetical protein [Cohnella sp. AR92]RUS47070.1 hypothetical protein ELR57_11770 [Cohnella sp. AR92]